jgi:hypothetical protein
MQNNVLRNRQIAWNYQNSQKIICENLRHLRTFLEYMERKKYADYAGYADYFGYWE